MAVLSRDQFFSRIQDALGTDTSDDTIAFIEDMTDTYNDLEHRANGDGTDWERRYHELDESWKQRYRHRFFSGNGQSNLPNTESDIDNDDNSESITFGDLFN